MKDYVDICTARILRRARRKNVFPSVRVAEHAARQWVFDQERATDSAFLRANTLEKAVAKWPWYGPQCYIIRRRYSFY